MPFRWIWRLATVVAMGMAPGSEVMGQPPLMTRQDPVPEMPRLSPLETQLLQALAADPAIVLLDEPFGALDPLTRRRLQEEFLALKARLQKTMVLVTHDVDEAFRLADQIAVFGDGQVLQVGTPAAIRAAPVSPFVAAFLDPHAAQASRDA